MNLIKNIYQTFLRIIAPPFCAHCKQFLSQRTVFCDECANKIKPVVSTTLRITQTKSVKVFAVSGYEQPLKGLILAKSSANLVGTKKLATLIWDHTNIKHSEFDCITSIALHWTRYAYRGYNQAHEIAKELGKLSNKKVVELLKRKKYTVYQSKLSYDKRIQNVENIFVLKQHKKEQFKNKHILLVDDLMTTGATLKAACKELFKLKPASITVVVACRTV